jgi:hypothetical protein
MAGNILPLGSMKTALRILAWLLLATVILGWRAGPTSFQQRWVAMPQAMSWQTLNAARKAAERPAAMTYTYCKWSNCQRG